MGLGRLLVNPEKLSGVSELDDCAARRRLRRVGGFHAGIGFFHIIGTLMERQQSMSLTNRLD